MNHQIILSKLPYYGIHGPTLDWFKSYLEDRKQRVIIGKNFSQWNSVIAGVPQGSVLGPLLFVLYLNDLDSINLPPNFHLSLYADDIAIYGSSPCFGSLESSLQNVVHQIESWLAANRMKSNISKTVSMLFGSH